MLQFAPTNNMLMFIVLLVCSSQVSVSSQQAGPQVQTSRGLVVGLDMDHTNTTGVMYRAFLGVPYGDQPTRFQLAQRKSPWKGPLYTQQDGLPCPQPNTKVYSEDCLKLNVFTPQNSSSESKWPVMVYVYGSGFREGSSNSLVYGPDFLVNGGVVIVTFNFRMGATGYLTLGTAITPGNLGLHDALLLLQWVQREITVFGGDPTRVTLAGHSSGSITVNHLLISPLSYKNGQLFSQVMMLAGPGFCECCYLTVSDAVKKSRLLARSLNCDFPSDLSATLSCLQAADIHHVIGNQSIVPMTTQEYTTFKNRPFLPIIDDWLVTNSSIFNGSLDDMTREAARRNIPMMLGFIRDEGIFAIDQNEYWKLAEAHLEAFIPLSVADKLSGEDRKSVVDKIRSRYFPGGPAENKMACLVDLYGDIIIKYGMVKTARYFRHSAYAYYFEYEGSWAWDHPYFSQFRLKAFSHGDELPYIWRITGGNQYLDKCKDNLDNLKVKDIMVQLFTNFIKTGNPSNGSVPWKVLAESDQYLVINTQLSTINASEVERKHFDLWADIEASTLSGSTNPFMSTSVLLLIMICIAQLSHPL